METIADRVRMTRETQGMTVTTLAVAVGCSTTYVSHVENGTIRAPSLTIGLRFAKALDVDPYWLATGQEDTLEARVTRLENIVEHLLGKTPPRR